MGLDLPDVRLVIHGQHPASVEDYLQEFGRAGRDQKVAVAVLFTGENDVRLLTFMAEKTSEMAGGDAETRASVLEFKLEAIRDVRRITTSRGACVRRSITKYFGESTSPQRRSIAVRIVEWLLSRSVRIRQTKFCCDDCDRVNANNVVDWAVQIFAQERQDKFSRRERASTIESIAPVSIAR